MSLEQVAFEHGARILNETDEERNARWDEHFADFGAMCSSVRLGGAYIALRRERPWMRRIALAVGVLAAFVAGRYVGLNTEQSANDLLSVGFTITDTEGFAIERFDSGFWK